MITYETLCKRKAVDSAKQVLEVKSDFADTCFHVHQVIRLMKI